MKSLQTNQLLKMLLVFTSCLVKQVCRIAAKVRMVDQAESSGSHIYDLLYGAMLGRPTDAEEPQQSTAVRVSCLMYLTTPSTGNVILKIESPLYDAKWSTHSGSSSVSLVTGKRCIAD